MHDLKPLFCRTSPDFDLIVKTTPGTESQAHAYWSNGGTIFYLFTKEAGFLCRIKFAWLPSEGTHTQTYEWRKMNFDVPERYKIYDDAVKSET